MMASLSEGKDFESDVKVFSTNQPVKPDSKDQWEITIIFNVYVLRKSYLLLMYQKALISRAIHVY